MDLLTLWPTFDLLTPKAYHFEYIPRSFPITSLNSLGVIRFWVIIIIIIIIRSHRQQGSVASTYSRCVHDGEPWTIRHECQKVCHQRFVGSTNCVGDLFAGANREGRGQFVLQTDRQTDRRSRTSYQRRAVIDYYHSDYYFHLAKLVLVWTILDLIALLSFQPFVIAL